MSKATEQLREKILDLAFKGMLVEKNESSPEAIIDNLNLEKKRVLSNRRYKTTDFKRRISILNSDDCHVPSTWALVPFRDAIFLISGRDLETKYFNDQGKGVPYITGASNFSEGRININRWTIDPAVISETSDILITCKGTVGAIAVNNIGPCHIARQVMAIRNLLSANIANKYIEIYLDYVFDSLKQKSKGIIPGISRTDLLNLLLPIPAYDEQQRIVDKVEQLFEQIDEIERLEAELEKNVELIKFIVRERALDGSLKTQSPSDTPSKTIIKSILEVKKKAADNKKIRKSELKIDSLIEINDNGIATELFRDGSSQIITSEIPHFIPASWSWVRFGVLGDYKKGPFGSSITKAMFVPESSDTVKIYEQKNAIQKDADLGKYFITKEKYESLKQFEVFPGDIIVSCAGTIGETFEIPIGAKKGIINQALMRMTFWEKDCKEYLLQYFDHVLKNNAKEQGHGIAMKNIPPFDVLKKYLVPLPPINEQKRIVETLEIVDLNCDLVSESIK